MGLRERQKQERTDRILEAAAVLFSNKGYEATRVEDIVEAANLSPATFYNYFHNKGDILIATLLLEQDAAISAGELVIHKRLENVEAALNAMVGAYYDNSFMFLTKEMWRQAMALTIQQSSAPFAKQYLEIDRRIRVQISSLLLDLQSRGRIPTRLNAEQVGDLVFNNINMTFIDFIRSDETTVEDVRKIFEAQNRTIAELLAV